MVQRFLVILLSSLVLSIACKDFLLFANFKINQDFIAEVLCINKDEPELECNGKCYLAKKVEKQQEQEQNFPSQKEIPNFNLIPGNGMQIDFLASVEKLYTRLLTISSKKHCFDLIKPPNIFA